MITNETHNHKFSTAPSDTEPCIGDGVGAAISTTLVGRADVDTVVGSEGEPGALVVVAEAGRILAGGLVGAAVGI